MGLYSCIRPLLTALDAETAHRLTLQALKAGVAPKQSVSDLLLKTTFCGLSFDNPLGLAAGFDKDAEVMAQMLGMGFGFVEAGTVTPRPQPGNPRPRVFRDMQNKSVINRMGFPGKGLEVFAKNLAGFRAKHPKRGVVGANIGINKDAASPAEDYRRGIEKLSALADYITINVSSPNTAGLRNLQGAEALDKLLKALVECANTASRRVPLLLKVAPDLDADARADIARLALAHKIDGLIVSNTTITRPPQLAAALQKETGGLSGGLVKTLALETLRDFYVLTGGAMPLIGVGGIETAEDAYARIRAGASLIQLYTPLVFEGSGLIPRILEGLAALLRRDGLTLAGAVGLDAGQKAVKAVI